MSLKTWFGKGSKGDWVDIGAPKKDGKFQPCGRKSTKGSKRKRGAKMRKKGAKGAPTAANFARAKQTARKK